MAEISATLYTNAKQTRRDRVGGNRKSSFNCQAKRGHSRLVPQGLCPPHLGGGGEESDSVWGAGRGQLMDSFLIGWW